MTIPDKAKLAGYDYVEGLAKTSMGKEIMIWHGYALREAFIAGVQWQAKKEVEKLPCTWTWICRICGKPVPETGICLECKSQVPGTEHLVSQAV